MECPVTGVLSGSDVDNRAKERGFTEYNILFNVSVREILSPGGGNVEVVVEICRHYHRFVDPVG